MDQSVIYALDFDGVLCDSAIETGVSGWKTATQIWDDFSSPLPSSEMLQQFCQVRPIMRTGYESILIMRFLKDGQSVDQIMQDFPDKKQLLINDIGIKVNVLKQLFGETRDTWIQNDLADWVGMNPLFPGISDKLKRLTEQGIWYIVTTKQERFVEQILNANHVSLPTNRIYGLDRNLSKPEILKGLVSRHQQQEIRFVEDMLPALKKVMATKELASVKLFLASWGFNTEQDRQDVCNYPVELIDLEEFLC